jgi:hypothetical protein
VGKLLLLVPSIAVTNDEPVRISAGAGVSSGDGAVRVDRTGVGGGCTGEGDSEEFTIAVAQKAMPHGKRSVVDSDNFATLVIDRSD